MDTLSTEAPHSCIHAKRESDALWRSDIYPDALERSPEPRPKRAGGLVTSSFIEQLRYEFIEVRRDMIEC